MAFVKVLFVILSVIFVFFSLLPTVAYSVYKKRARTWPVVAAKITYARLLNQSDANGQPMVEAIIHFDYEFRGKTYTSETPTLIGIDRFPSLDYQRGLIDKYQKGEYYNAKVSPNGRFAFLEVAPLSVASAVYMPLFGLGYLLFLFLYINFFASLF